jgi:hypothetical protein
MQRSRKLLRLLETVAALQPFRKRRQEFKASRVGQQHKVRRKEEMRHLLTGRRGNTIRDRCLRLSFKSLL